MYQQLDNGVNRVITTLTSESHKRANRHYYAMFREYLVCEDIPYSHQVALDWLSENEHIFPRWKYLRCRTAVFKLNDMLTNESVTAIGHYPYDNSPKYAKLSAWSRKLLDSALVKTKYAGSARNNFRIAVAEFLWLLEKIGVGNRDEISVKHFAEYRHYAKETHSTGICRDYSRLVITFLFELSGSNAFCSLAKMKGSSSALLLDDLPDDQKNLFIDSIRIGKVDSMSVDDFLEIMRKEDERLAIQRYASETRRKYSDTRKSLCLFLILNGLDYSPQIAQCWADYSNRKLVAYPSTENCAWHKKTNLFPAWGLELLEQYLFDERRNGKEQSTLITVRYACLKFLQFLEQRGIGSCEEITPAIVNEFHLADHHATPGGKKAYNSKIGRFLEFLGDHGLVPKTLRLALPCKIAQHSIIVQTLNDDDIRLLCSEKDKAVTPLALRDAAIVMIGLRTGLRAIDIVSLKYSNISWKEQTISIIQHKTDKHLALPMPVEVGNCIYRYLTQGRPTSGLDYIFISYRAPYSELRPSACADALNRMLRPNGQRYGFHITRKTFASRMLKSGNSADSIAHLLGHDGSHTVMKYLSTDDEKMRMCAITAGKVVSV